jgi:hypothetical protein
VLVRAHDGALSGFRPARSGALGLAAPARSRRSHSSASLRPCLVLHAGVPPARLRIDAPGPPGPPTRLVAGKLEAV